MAVYVSTAYCDAMLGGQSFAQVFQDGCIELRSGAQPASADAAATGTLLARITRDGGAWTAGSPTNGLRWEQDGRFVIKQTDHIWNMVGLGTGTIGWFRMLANPADPGTLSSVYPRIDGRAGVIGVPGDYQFFAPNLSVTPGSSIEINQWYFALPPLET